VKVALLRLPVFLSGRGENVDVNAENGLLYIFLPESGLYCVKGAGETLHVCGHVVRVRSERSIDDRRIDCALCLGCPDEDKVCGTLAAKIRPHLEAAGAVGLYEKAEQDIDQDEDGKSAYDDVCFMFIISGSLNTLRSLHT
jgi:hypothetical protein